MKTFTWRGKRGETRPVTLLEVRAAIPRMLVHFAGVRSRDQASELTNGELLVEASRLPDPGPGMAYTFQLIGLRVVCGDGRELGTLAEIIPSGAHPIYVVRGAKEILVPGHESVVKRVDLEAGVVTVELPAGLEDL